MDWEEQLSHLKHFHKSEIRAHAIVCRRGGIEDWAICFVHMYVDSLTRIYVKPRKKFLVGGGSENQIYCIAQV